MPEADRQGVDLSGRLALSPREAAESLSVSERTLRKWMRDEGLPFFRIDGSVRIPMEELRRWMAARLTSQRRADEIADEILADLGKDT